MEGCNHKPGEETHDHWHPDNERFENEIMLSDLFHIIDLAGRLMNKKEPSPDDTRPYDEFKKYSKKQIVADEATGE